MRTVRLNGELGKRYGRVHRLDVRTPAEALQALMVNHPALRRDLIESADRGIVYRCIVDRDLADADRLLAPVSREFSITPVVHGSGRAFGAILGATLLIGAMVLSGGFAAIGAGGASFSAAMGASTGFLGLTYGTVALIGGALLISGISQLLTPTPKTKDAQRNENPYFNGPANVTAQGAAVPIGYGRCIVGSAVISAGISVEQQTQTAPVLTGFGGRFL